MRFVLTPAEAAELDRATQERGVSADTLMEAAGREVADAALRLVGGAYGRRAVVVCGKGNNGGDGLVAARYLDRAGVRTTALLLDDAFSGPAASNLARLETTSVRRRAWSRDALERELERAGVAIDAIFGTGFRGTPAGPYAEAIEALAASSVPLVAVDIPSGVHGETGAVEGPAVRADLTVTFGAPKPGLVLLPGATYAGVIEVEPIGFPQDLIHSDLVLVEAEDVAAMLPPREADTHKRSAGYAVVVGGSRLMTGAVALAGAAAYRAGAGLVAVAVPEGILPVTQGAVREAANGRAFCREVLRRHKVRIDVISGEEEAQLAFGSASRHFNLEGRSTAVVDIGGGSVEVILATGSVIDQVHSLPLGAVRVTERLVRSDPLREKHWKLMRKEIDRSIRAIGRPLHRAEIMVGSGGTFTALAHMAKWQREGRHGSVQGYVLTPAEVVHLLDQLREAPLEVRRQIPGLSPDRADIIVAGATVISRLVRRLGTQQILVNESGIREGLLLRMISDLTGGLAAGQTPQPTDRMV
jgi:hydroxyethylthiazole kinase-like uncharacterized protein yjeF